jgi:hypothetical protein
MDLTDILMTEIKRITDAIETAGYTLLEEGNSVYENKGEFTRIKYEHHDIEPIPVGEENLYAAMGIQDPIKINPKTLELFMNEKKGLVILRREKEGKLIRAKEFILTENKELIDYVAMARRAADFISTKKPL